MERECSGSPSVGDPENHFRKNRTFQKQLGLQPRQMVQNEEWGAVQIKPSCWLWRRHTKVAVWCSVGSTSVSAAFQKHTFRPSLLTSKPRQLQRWAFTPGWCVRKILFFWRSPNALIKTLNDQPTEDSEQCQLVAVLVVCLMISES